MDRNDFLKKGASFLGMALISPSLLASTRQAQACTVANGETAGPFPTKSPATLTSADIRGDRTGVAFAINITVRNVNGNCNPQQGLIVDIWHCDREGNYSEYGGTQMQSTDYTSKHFLRGRQVTDANGKVSFTSLFPGWYTGRATHIHVHVYTASGASVLISQIAFPEGSGSAVETVNASTANGYTKGMNGYTYNAQDNVFSDGTTTEMATVTGSVSAGYALQWDAYVATTAGVQDAQAQEQFGIRQNFPNPCTSLTRIPVVLQGAADVKLTVTDLVGSTVRNMSYGTMQAGEHLLDLDLSGLAAGRYVYSVKITNDSGTYRLAKLLVKE